LRSDLRRRPIPRRQAGTEEFVLQLVVPRHRRRRNHRRSGRRLRGGQRQLDSRVFHPHGGRSGSAGHLSRRKPDVPQGTPHRKPLHQGSAGGSRRREEAARD